MIEVVEGAEVPQVGPVYVDAGQAGDGGPGDVHHRGEVVEVVDREVAGDEVAETPGDAGGGGGDEEAQGEDGERGVRGFRFTQGCERPMRTGETTARFRSALVIDGSRGGVPGPSSWATARAMRMFRAFRAPESRAARERPMPMSERHGRAAPRVPLSM